MLIDEYGKGRWKYYETIDNNVYSFVFKTVIVFHIAMFKK